MSNINYTQDDPRLRPIRPSQYPWKPLPSSQSASDVVKVSLIYTSTITIPTNWCTSFDIGKESIELPCPAVLIEKGDKALLFDLGFREDPENFPEPFGHATFKIAKSSPAPGPIKILQKENFDLDRLQTVFISHTHLDHYGDIGTLPFAERPIILGPGSLVKVCPGYPEDQDGQWPSWWFEKYRFVELPDTHTEGSWNEEFSNLVPGKGKVGWEKLGCFENAVDWYGDGSFWLVDAPGHCPGHLMAFCRVTAQPDTYILFGADTAHHQNMYLPIPSAEDDDLRSPKSVVDGRVQLTEDPVTATWSVGTLARMSMEDNVMVLLAHEPEAVGVLDQYPQDINDWKAKGWKDQKQKKVIEDANIRRHSSQ